MPELLTPQSQQDGQKSPHDALRYLSRSPHPYHRNRFDLPRTSEKSAVSTSSTQSSLHTPESSGATDQETVGPGKDGYRDLTNSDSGTEADDEHFLKGLPAPKLRPHKGLRGADGGLSNSPSPLLSPTVLDEGDTRTQDYRRSTLPTIYLNEEDSRKAVSRFRQRRRVEVVRRTTEAMLLIVLGGVISRDPNIRSVLRFWRSGKVTK